MIRAVVLAAALAVLGAPAPARADNQAEAVALFDQGQKELKAGNYDKACKHLAASLALVADSGTRGSLARCYEKQNKLASAWTLWRQLADIAPTADLRRAAARNAAKLDARVPKYVVKLAGTTPGLELTVNGKPVDVTLDVPLPLDPGPVAVTASAPGYTAWSDELVASAGKTLTIEVPELAAVEVVRPPAPPRPSAASQPGKTRRRLGVAMTALGGGALIAGGVFGVITRQRFDEAKELCGGDIDACDPAGIELARTKVGQARKAGNLSTALFAGGGAAALLGIIIVVTAPSAPATPSDQPRLSLTPMVGPDGAGLLLTGRM